MSHNREDYGVIKIMVTGHRPDKLGGYNENPISTAVQKTMIYFLNMLKNKHNKIWCISGMALGTDQWFAQHAVDLGIPFTAAVPFDGQEKKWPQESQNKYKILIEHAREQVIVSPGEYAGWKMSQRNKWMIDNSDIAIVVYDPGSKVGGTYNAWKTIQKKKLPTIWIKPSIQPVIELIRTQGIL